MSSNKRTQMLFLKLVKKTLLRNLKKVRVKSAYTKEVLNVISAS